MISLSRSIVVLSLAFAATALAAGNKTAVGTNPPTPESLAAVSGPTWTVPPLDYFINKLPPPPRTGSYRDRMDLLDAIAQQSKVSKHDLASIQRTYLFTVFTFDDVLGPQFNPKRFPKTAAFFTKLTNTANGVLAGLKNHYQRLRPFEAHPDKIKLLVRREASYSYPSGHTTRSRLSALVLAQLDPPNRTALVQASERVGFDRILAGEHYLTDLEGGRKLAKILFYLLSKNQDFLADLAAVKAAEWTPPLPAPAKK